MRKPAPLRRGDVIGVVAPAAAVDSAALAAGIHALEQLGFQVHVGPAVFHRDGYLAGSDQERLADLIAMFHNPEVKAIIGARGGYGSGRLLPLLDPAVARAHPKIVVGFSDLTFVLSDLVQRSGLVAFHGPDVVHVGRNAEAATRLAALLGGERHDWNLRASDVIQPGTAEGRIVGGCLSVLVATLGTPYAIETDRCLLFLEDTNEKPFRIDRMLTQLRQAGKLDQVAGVVFADMHACSAGPDEAVTVRDVIAEAFAGAIYPVAFGLPSGHGTGSVTLPLGVRARLAGERLTLLESPLSE
ncbi:MAG: LD-carboxypeptidase [Deltaproteobacteria bacterium]|nr:LD-carboxypeptidase [Deltaproteobacteria bacterium]MBI3387078.1 LD-carboxypeptidase [Deltaproteobacteria bacterium]